MTTQEKTTVERLLKAAGRTCADEAGIKLTDKPSPLYRLLVLSVLLSTRIKADIAVAAARELSDFPTPRKMLDATWQQRVDALGRAHYVRYDESTATALGDGAQVLLDEYQGDLRRLRDEAGDTDGLRTLLQDKVPRLGPVGANIFCREAQAVWPALRPFLDDKVLSGAKKIGLPSDVDRLADLVRPGQLAELAAGLVRVDLDRRLAGELRS